MSNEERIKADAEAYANGVGDVYRKYASLYGYIAGATAENSRAQVLVDALEGLLEWHNTTLGYGLGRKIEAATEALNAWNGNGQKKEGIHE